MATVIQQIGTILHFEPKLCHTLLQGALTLSLFMYTGKFFLRRVRFRVTAYKNNHQN